MLTHQHLAIVRAALRFWKEEIAIHDADTARPYLDLEGVELLNERQIEALIRNLGTVRYAIYDRRTRKLRDRELLEPDVASILAASHEIATVLLPV